MYSDDFIATYRGILEDNNMSDGALYKNIKGRVKGLRVEISIEDYWKWLENGRAPGKRPPMSAIEKWIANKRITPFPDSSGKIPTDRSLAYIIARSIGENGLPARGFFSKANDQTFEEYREDITIAATQDIERQIKVTLI